jgi:phosphate transport system substrate-binding protein
MWQKQKKDNSIVSLALLLALATTPIAASVVVSDLALAQSNDVPSFTLPKAVQSGTTVRIDGSSSMYTINQTMKERFEKKFPGARVEAAANGADVALIALKEGLIDIAAIGRGLTPEEKKQGLEQLRLRREKIAIIVSEDNPFKGNLTNRGFARIFRGEVTDWSELGRASGKIRVIDRPHNSDMRESFHSYPAFQNAKFATGATAVELKEDSTVEVVKQLGRDGIGYVLANQVSKLKGVRVLMVNRTLPGNPKYPFSQPLVYVYKKNPGLNVASFLGFVTNAPGKEAVEAARTEEAEAIAAAMSAESPTATTTDSTTTSPSADATSAASVPPTAPGETNITTADSSTLAAPVQSNQTTQEKKLLLWSILAVSAVAVAGLLLWFLRRRRPATRKTTDVTIKSSPPDSPLDATTPQQTANVNSATQTTPNDLTQDATSIPSDQNTAKHLTPTMAASIAGGAAIGAGSTLVSKWSEKNSEITAKDQTDVNHSSSVQVPLADGSRLDLEAPVTVVNAPYPQFASDPQATLVQDNTQILSAHHSDVTDHQTPSSVDFTEVPAPAAGAANSYSPLPDVWEDATQLQTPLVTQPEVSKVTSVEETPTVFQQPDLELPEISEVTSVEETPTVFQQPDLELPEISEVTSVEETPTVFQQPDLELPEISEVASVEETPTVFQQPDLELPEITEVASVEETPTVFQQPDLELPEITEVASVEETPTVFQQPDLELPEISEVTSVEETPTVFQQPDLELPEISEVTSVEETPTVFQQPETNQEVLNLETPLTVANTAYAPLPDFWEDTPPEQVTAVGSDVETTLELPDLSEELWGVVADTTEPQVNLPEEVAQTTPTPDSSVIISNFTEQTTPSTTSGISGWNYIDGMGNNQNFNVGSSQADVVDETATVPSATTKPKDVNSENIIVLTPRTPKWAYVYWQVSDDAKQALRSQGGSQFTLRLYDATDIDLSYQTPVLVQQYECEETTEDRYVAIPAGDRNYMAEIGYTTADNHWLLLACSEIVRVFSRPEKDFWFIADAELIIHGATEPGSNVTVAGHTIKLKPDGTFHLRIPFTDSLIDYVMTATDTDGQRAKTIRMHFSQDNPEE